MLVVFSYPGYNRYATVIPEIIKSRVISQWLQGLNRDIIAQDNNISTGAVSNITNDWSIALGKPEADALRELAKSLNIIGLTPAQCAIGFRTMKLLSAQGIVAEAAADFIEEKRHTGDAKIRELHQVNSPHILMTFSSFQIITTFHCLKLKSF